MTSAGQESVGRTMLVAVAVALACSAMVTTAVYLLKPLQAAYAAVERNRAIAVAAGVAAPGAPDDEVVAAYLDLEAFVIDLETGGIARNLDGRSYDHWQTLTDGPPRFVPVYLSVEDGALARVVVPLDGPGMWSRLYGYLALGPDLNTVLALVIHGHGETPGIGDRIQSPDWLAGWTGKQVRDADGRVSLAVSDDRALPARHRVDVITGATISSQAVGGMVRVWLGPQGLGDVLAGAIERWRAEEGR